MVKNFWIRAKKLQDGFPELMERKTMMKIKVIVDLRRVDFSKFHDTVWKFLKAKIREWNKFKYVEVWKIVEAKYKEELEALEAGIIDRGDGNEEIFSRFDKPDAVRATINLRYPKNLTYDQQNELESEVSNVGDQEGSLGLQN
ncbi:hypothetical protein Tco_0880337 [Tanacetum coccineum]